MSVDPLRDIFEAQRLEILHLRAENASLRLATYSKGRLVDGETPRFYIFAKEHSTKCDHCLWWNPGAKGYTCDLNRAGLFTEAEAREIEADSHGDHVAIPEVAAMSADHRRCITFSDLRTATTTMEGGASA